MKTPNPSTPKMNLIAEKRIKESFKINGLGIGPDP
jgi:hypothetical protein